MSGGYISRTTAAKFTNSFDNAFSHDFSSFDTGNEVTVTFRIRYEHLHAVEVTKTAVINIIECQEQTLVLPVEPAIRYIVKGESFELTFDDS